MAHESNGVIKALASRPCFRACRLPFEAAAWRRVAGEADTPALATGVHHWSNSICGYIGLFVGVSGIASDAARSGAAGFTDSSAQRIVDKLMRQVAPAD